MLIIVNLPPIFCLELFCYLQVKSVEDRLDHLVDYSDIQKHAYNIHICKYVCVSGISRH